MTLQEQIRANRARTLLVWLGFGLIAAVVVLVIGGLYDPSLAGFAGIAAIVYGLWAYATSGKIVARASGARQVSREEAPGLWNAVDNAAIAAGLARTPDIYLIDDPAPNAFAAGRKLETSYVAATTGLLALMDKRELEGVMAHEIAHVRNRDVQLMTLAAVLTGSIVLVCDLLMRFTFWGGSGRRDNGLGIVGMILGIVVLVLAPAMAMLMQMALSRRREYLADASAVEITGDADGLASALSKLAADPTPLRKVTRATAHMYIESPLRDHVGLRSGLGGLFDTHPPLEERIRRLQEFGGLAAPAGPLA